MKMYKNLEKEEETEAVTNAQLAMHDEALIRMKEKKESDALFHTAWEVQKKIKEKKKHAEMIFN
jgi:hypothetical protein